MNKVKVSKKEVKKKVLASFEAVLMESILFDNSTTLAKKMKEAGSILTDFIVHHSKAVGVKSKPAASKVKAKKSTTKKTVKVKTA